MPSDIKWFTVPLEAVQAQEVRSRLPALGFVSQGEIFRDAAFREVIVEEACVRIGLSKTDVVDEQEQLEFVAAGLGLDADQARKV